MKTSYVVGIIFSIILIAIGIFFPVPKKHLLVSENAYNNNWFENGEKYVGGDAYNYQMEASLKAGWVSGVIVLKSIGISVGITLLMISIYSNERDKELAQQNKILREISEKLSSNDSPNANNISEEKHPQESSSPSDHRTNLTTNSTFGKLCTNCGKIIPNDSEFCQNCGVNIKKSYNMKR